MIAVLEGKVGPEDQRKHVADHLLAIKEPDPGIVETFLASRADDRTVGPYEAHNLHVCLHVMTRGFLRVAVRVNGHPPHIAGKAPQSVANKRPVNDRTRDLDPMIAFQVPSNPLRTEAVGLPEFKDPLYGLLGQRLRVMMSDWPLGNESGGPVLSGRFPPFIDSRFRNSKLAIGLDFFPDELSILENSQLLRNRPSLDH